MNKIFLFPIAFFCLLISCSQQSQNNMITKRTIDNNWLDSIIKISDSSYSKPYKRTDFVTAFFYVNKKDSSVCEVMKDSAQTIRQVILAKKNIRRFFAGFYDNGQLQANLPLDEFGQYHGEATYYYPGGGTESTGNYEHGIKTGAWKYFDEKGRLLSAEKYDHNGQVIK